MSPRIRLLILASGWAGAAFGVLALERIPGHYEHELCGPWGCMPPLQALAAMHGFWLMLFLPPTAWLIVRASPATLRLAGAFAFWIGMFGLVVVAGRALESWLQSTGEFPQYVGQRLLYAVVTATDMPFGQLALAGVVSWLVGRHRTRRGSSPPHVPAEAAVSTSLTTLGELVADERFPQQIATESVGDKPGTR